MVKTELNFLTGLEPAGYTHPWLMRQQHFMFEFIALKKYAFSALWANVLQVIRMMNA